MVEIIIKSDDGKKAIVLKDEYVFCVVGKNGDTIARGLLLGEIKAAEMAVVLGRCMDDTLMTLAEGSGSDEDGDDVKRWMALEHAFLSSLFGSNILEKNEPKGEGAKIPDGHTNNNTIQ